MWEEGREVSSCMEGGRGWTTGYLIRGHSLLKGRVYLPDKFSLQRTVARNDCEALKRDTTEFKANLSDACATSSHLHPNHIQKQPSFLR
jgi:hypothetical protein